MFALLLEQQRLSPEFVDLGRQCCLLMGVGADISLLRTYNSLDGWLGDNGDAWRLGYYRRIGSLTGTLNAAGSTLTRTDADGFESTYTWRDGRYVGTDGADAYDSLVVAAGVATWTDGDTGLTELYAETTAGQYRLTCINDPEGRAARNHCARCNSRASSPCWRWPRLAPFPVGMAASR